MRRLFFISTLILGAFSVPGFAQAPRSAEHFEKMLSVTKNWPGVIRSSLGVTGQGTPIQCLYHKEDLDLNTPKTRILLVAGFRDQNATLAALEALSWFYVSEEAAPFRKSFSLSVVPWMNPDNAAPPKFPPKGDGYNSKHNTEAEYLWRWVGMHAPDLVVSLVLGESEGWKTSAEENHPAGRLAAVLGKRFKGESSESAESLQAVMKSAPCGTGTIPVITAMRKAADPRPEKFLQALLQGIQRAKFQGPSPARKELQSRANRTPLEIARQLAKVYGHELPSVQYIPALALVGRLWLGELTNDPAHRTDVERIVAPYVSGNQPTLPENASGSHQAGHLIFAELARTTPNKQQAARYRELARQAAELGFDAEGQMKAAMPAHNEMSDAVFMSCPILVETGIQTGAEKFLKMAERHFAFMRARVLRKDGIYRHSPLCETAWGRGNGFPALGLAWSLSVLPQDHPLFSKYLAEFQSHMAALITHQDPTGMWHQVVDDEASYREMSSTCMITFAMIRGVRNGWLEEKTYGPVIENAFHAIKTRIAADGTLVDVCTGTGKQKTLRDYYDRKAILGRDDRGGAMALLVTTEMARWKMGKD